MAYTIPQLPLTIDLETKPILKQLTKAHRALAELKGVVGTIPNQSILISTLFLQEAKDSSAIENIITTHDELYQSDAVAKQFTTFAAKEVYSYAAALQDGYQKVRKSGLITNIQILEIQQTLVENSAGFRKLPGTVLKNEATGAIVYSPPQSESEILALMNNLEQFINDDQLSDVDSLVKMAIIHHQFESIHPFYDGNGRTGRILNMLYLVKNNLIDSPVLYMSRYINQTKGEYYRLLQAVRDAKVWEEWILYMLIGIEQTSHQTTKLIHDIRDLMEKYKIKLREELPKIYSQDLINSLFRHPYTKIDFITVELQITRKTAAKYLEEIVQIGLLSKHKKFKENYFVNDGLFNLLLNNSPK
jgi:Fic family protein